MHLLVVGDGPERAHLETLANMSQPGRCHFTGALPNPLPAYLASDVSILASRTESMPATLIEAGLCGLPAIAARVGSIEQVLLNGETGLLCPPDSVVDLSIAIEQVTKDEALRCRLGVAAAAHCEQNFEMRPVAARWSATLVRVAQLRLLKPRPPGTSRL